MNRTVAVLIFAVLLSAAILWAGGAGIVAYRNWHDTHARIERTRDTGKNDCGARYGDLDAVQRCKDLIEVRYVTDLNIARVTRAAIALGPLIAVALAALTAWRSASERARRRRDSLPARRSNRSSA
jgi:hypothetical protein